MRNQELKICYLGMRKPFVAMTSLSLPFASFGQSLVLGAGGADACQVLQPSTL